MGCFWGAERLFWQTRRRVHDRGRLRRGLHAEPDLRGGVLGPHRPHRGRAGGLRPARSSYEALLKVFWEGHDPTQGMRQGNDVGTQYRSGDLRLPTTEQARGRGAAGTVRGAARRGRLRRHHHRDRRGRPFYYAEDYHQQYLHKVPERLLRAGWHRRELPGGRGLGPTAGRRAGGSELAGPSVALATTSPASRRRDPSWQAHRSPWRPHRLPVRRCLGGPSSAGPAPGC